MVSSKDKDKDKEGTSNCLKFIDLFCGVGGMRLGLESACREQNKTPECVFSSDIQEDSATIYEKNFQENPLCDVTKIKESNLNDFDVLLAGFSCQAFSISGKRLGFADTRGTLFYDVLRIVREKKPKALLLENVRNLVGHDGGNTLKTILQCLENELYTVYWQVLVSSDFNVPQARQRVYIVAIRGEHIPFRFPSPSEKTITVGSILDSDIKDSMFIKRDDIVFTKKIDSIPPNTRKPFQLGYVNKGGQGERIYSPLAVGITLSAYGGGVGSKTGLYLIDNKIRKLTPRECARMQGFPDSFSIHGNSNVAYRHFGNSVSVPVIEKLCINLIKAIDK